VRRPRVPNRFSTFSSDIEQAVDNLVAHGVPMIRFGGYETDDRGIHQSRGHSIAWFTDPAGNCLSLFQQGRA
jgi:hypothetical protein